MAVDGREASTYFPIIITMVLAWASAARLSAWAT
jgi:hypothetical protein